MRPKKPRYHCGCKDLAACQHGGVLLADRLYTDPRKRVGFYFYVLPDGRKCNFPASSPVEANTIAAEALEAFEQTGGEPGAAAQPTRDQVAFHIPLYIEKMEKNNPNLVKRSQWYNDKVHFKQFARENFKQLRMITFDTLDAWWDTLTYHQQKQRKAPFRKWFNWMMSKRLLPQLEENPFMIDSRVQLLLKVHPGKKRPPLIVHAYKKIHAAAGELGYACLQIAMELGLYTSLRESDICLLQRKLHLKAVGEGDWLLKLAIGKSEAQHGAIGAARLEWDTRQHPVLKRIIDRALALCLANKGCPFLISHTPKRRVWNDEKQHICQVTADRLSHMFLEARAHAFPEVEFSKANPGPSFHEVRGLASTLYRKAGYAEADIQELMAHEDVNTTKGYMDVDELPYKAITMQLSEDFFG